LVSIDITEAGRFRELSVTDNGPGITDEQRSNLFQPFATTKPDGLGLGLVISQDIMRGLGGDLVEVQMATGTRFKMIIPGT